MNASKTVSVTTRRGITSQVHVWDQPEHGASSIPIVYFHGASGLLADEPMLDALGRRYEIYAPVWPGFADEPGEELLEDMLDFTLHGWDIVEVLGTDAGLSLPHLVGHSMGAMIAAEMACVAPGALERLVLIDPLGIWLDSSPIPDLFAQLPFELPALLFHDAPSGAAKLTGGLDFRDPKALETFMVGNSRRLGTAGKILFPIPSRRVKKRLYRINNPTLLLWGENDRLVPADVYGPAWQRLITHAELDHVAEAGHMLPVEQGPAAAARIRTFLG